MPKQMAHESSKCEQNAMFEHHKVSTMIQGHSDNSLYVRLSWAECNYFMLLKAAMRQVGPRSKAYHENLLHDIQLLVQHCCNWQLLVQPGDSILQAEAWGIPAAQQFMKILLKITTDIAIPCVKANVW